MEVNIELSKLSRTKDPKQTWQGQSKQQERTLEPRRRGNT
jgi:hypothetical protein